MNPLVAHSVLALQAFTGLEYLSAPQIFDSCLPFLLVNFKTPVNKDSITEENV